MPPPADAQGHVLADDVLDRRALLDQGDVLVLDPTRHSASSSGVPSLGGQRRQVPDDLPGGHAAGVAVPRAGVQRHAVDVAVGRRTGTQALR